MRNLSWLDENMVVFGEVCDSCGFRMNFGVSCGVGKHVDGDGEAWLLCADCMPVTTNEEE